MCKYIVYHTWRPQHESNPKLVIMDGVRCFGVQCWSDIKSKCPTWIMFDQGAGQFLAQYPKFWLVCLLKSHTILKSIPGWSKSKADPICHAEVPDIQRDTAPNKPCHFWASPSCSLLWELIIIYSENLIMDYNLCKCNKSWMLIITVANQIPSVSGI